MCEFTGCEDYHTEVSVIHRGERISFCSLDHAALWLIQEQYPHVKRIILEPKDVSTLQ